MTDRPVTRPEDDPLCAHRCPYRRSAHGALDHRFEAAQQAPAPDGLRKAVEALVLSGRLDTVHAGCVRAILEALDATPAEPDPGGPHGHFRTGADAPDDPREAEAPAPEGLRKALERDREEVREAFETIAMVDHPLAAREYVATLDAAFAATPWPLLATPAEPRRPEPPDDPESIENRRERARREENGL